MLDLAVHQLSDAYSRQCKWIRSRLAAAAFCLVWMLWGFLLFVAPVSPVFRGTVESAALFIIAQVAMFSGLVCGKSRSSVYLIDVKRDISSGLLKVLLILSGVSVSYRIVDFVIIRQIDVFAGTLAVRAVLEKMGPNIFSAISAITSPAIYACAGLSIISLLKSQNKLLSAFGVSILPLSAIYSLSFGGRFPILVSLLYLLTFILLLRRPSVRMILAAGGVAGLFFFSTMFVFLARIGEYKIDLVEYLAISSLTEIVPPKPVVFDTLKSVPPLLGGIVFYLTSLSQYALHGVFEYFLLVKSLADRDLTWGQYQFFPLNRFLVLLSSFGLISPPSDINALNPRAGLYSTFWGAAYIDFGAFMPIYGFLVGLIIRFFERQVQCGNLFAVPLYALFLVQIFFVPISNGLTASGLLYVNIGLAAMWLVFSKYFRLHSVNR